MFVAPQEANLFPEWLVDRKKVPSTWKKNAAEIRKKIIAAAKVFYTVNSG